MTTETVQALSSWMMAAAEDFLSSKQLVPLAVILIAIFLLLRRPRRSVSSGTGQRKPPASLSAEERIRRDLDALMVELQELSRRTNAEIDTRFAKIEVVIRDADQRIATLNRLTRKGGKKSAEAPDEPDLRHQIVYELADAGMNPIQIAKELGKTPGEVELILNLRGKIKPGDSPQPTPETSPAADQVPPAVTKPANTTREPRKKETQE